MDINYKADVNLTVQEIEQIIRAHVAQFIDSDFEIDKINFKVADTSKINDSFQKYELNGATVNLKTNPKLLSK